MRSVLELAWEVLPRFRRARVANASVWFQLAVANRDVERRIERFMREACAYDERNVRARFIRKRDTVHEVLFCIVRVCIAKRCTLCSEKLDAYEREFETCENCFYEDYN